MPVLTSESSFTLGSAPERYVEEVDLHFYPQNNGSLALRRLAYPDDVYPPLDYEDNPDRTENFDSEPWTHRPQVGTELTISSAKIVNWAGYLKDRSIKEIWSGSSDRARMTGYFLRRLFEYFVNPPADDYIIWYPHDRTAQGYNIVIESVQVGGQDIVSFDWIAMAQGDVVPLEVTLQFRIISEASS